MALTEQHRDSGPTTRKTPHLARLDVVRGIAILLVVVFHTFGQAFGGDSFPFKGMWRDLSQGHGPYFVAMYPLTLGATGVAVFFVLSGFVIHYTTLGSLRTFDWRAFYLRRFFRIWPPYVIALLATVALICHYRWEPLSGRSLLAHMALVHNLFEKYLWGLSGPWWTLALEMQFYLMYPILLFLRSKFGIGGVFGLVWCLSFFLRAYGWVTAPWPVLQATYWYSPLIMLPDWMLGAYVAERYVQGIPAFPLAPRARAILMFFIVLCLIASHWWLPVAPLGFPLAALFTGLWIDAYLVRSSPTSKIVRQWEGIVAFVGVISYSWYLWHVAIIHFVSDHLPAQLANNPGPIRFVLLVLLVFPAGIGLSYLFYRFVEIHSQRFGKRLAERLFATENSNS